MDVLKLNFFAFTYFILVDQSSPATFPRACVSLCAPTNYRLFLKLLFNRLWFRSAKMWQKLQAKMDQLSKARFKKRELLSPRRISHHRTPQSSGKQVIVFFFPSSSSTLPLNVKKFYFLFL